MEVELRRGSEGLGGLERQASLAILSGVANRSVEKRRSNAPPLIPREDRHSSEMSVTRRNSLDRDRPDYSTPSGEGDEHSHSSHPTKEHRVGQDGGEVGFGSILRPVRVKGGSQALQHSRDIRWSRRMYPDSERSPAGRRRGSRAHGPAQIYRIRSRSASSSVRSRICGQAIGASAPLRLSQTAAIPAPRAPR